MSTGVRRDGSTFPAETQTRTIEYRGKIRQVVAVRDVTDQKRADAERARSNLARYFSPNIVDLIADSDEPLGPVRRQTVGVLFVDIVGFTRMAEAMTPEAVVGMLREFHERMTGKIFACGGTVEKYIGDEIFAVFGLPTASPHDAVNALRCAGMMLEELAAWNEARAARGEPALDIGIGLNYGPAVMGDVGSEHTLSFTVIGDTVNVASRLQSLTRELKTSMIVADAVLQQIGAGALPVELTDQGERELRGRTGTTRIWTKAK